MAAKGLWGLNSSAPQAGLLWHARNTLLTYLGTELPGRLEILTSGTPPVDCDYAGDAGGAWTSDLTVGENAYFGVQPVDVAAYRNADGSRWQAIFAIRLATSAGTVGGIVGGLATTRQSFSVAFSPNGGWDVATGTWGAGSLGGAFREVFGYTTASGTAPTSIVSLLVTAFERTSQAGVVNGLGLAMAGEVIYNTTSHKNLHLALGHYLPHLASEPFQCYEVHGLAALAATFKPTGYLTNYLGTTQNAAATSYEDRIGAANYAYAVDGSPLGRPIELLNSTAVNTKGYLAGIYANVASNPDNQPDGAHKFVVCNGLLYPVG